MKITKTRLTQIIKEELARLTEGRRDWRSAFVDEEPRHHIMPMADIEAAFQNAGKPPPPYGDLKRMQSKYENTPDGRRQLANDVRLMREADWDHPPEPAGSLGGYGDTDLYADPNPPPVETSIHQDFSDLQMGMRNPYTPWEMLSGGGRKRRLEAALANNPELEEKLRKAANDIRAPGVRTHRDLKAIGNAFFEELSAAIEKEYI